MYEYARKVVPDLKLSDYDLLVHEYVPHGRPAGVSSCFLNGADIGAAGLGGGNWVRLPACLLACFPAVWMCARMCACMHAYARACGLVGEEHPEQLWLFTPSEMFPIHPTPNPQVGIFGGQTNPTVLSHEVRAVML